MSTDPSDSVVDEESRRTACAIPPMRKRQSEKHSLTEEAVKSVTTRTGQLKAGSRSALRTSEGRDTQCIALTTAPAGRFQTPSLMQPRGRNLSQYLSISPNWSWHDGPLRLTTGLIGRCTAGSKPQRKSRRSSRW